MFEKIGTLSARMAFTCFGVQSFHLIWRCAFYLQHSGSQTSPFEWQPEPVTSHGICSILESKQIAFETLYTFQFAWYFFPFDCEREQCKHCPCCKDDTQMDWHADILRSVPSLKPEACEAFLWIKKERARTCFVRINEVQRKLCRVDQSIQGTERNPIIAKTSSGQFSWLMTAQWGYSKCTELGSKAADYQVSRYFGSAKHLFKVWLG